MDGAVLQIGETCRRLGVTPQHLRFLERTGRIPPAKRILDTRIYTPDDVALLRSLGIGSRPRRLKTVEEVLGG